MPTPSTAHRLRRHADYQRVYKGGRKQFARQLAYFYLLREPADQLRSATTGPRIGLTVPKAMAARAVDRNRIKRRLREAVRSALPLLQLPVDLVLHPRRTVLTQNFAQLTREIEQVFRTVQSHATAPYTPGPRPPRSRNQRSSSSQPHSTKPSPTKPAAPPPDPTA